MPKTAFMRSWVFIYMALTYFVAGVEDYIIMPTAWYYIRSLGGTKSFLGIVLSISSICALLFSLPFGVLSDKFRCPKTILIVCRVSALCGNAIYSFPVSKYCPLVGRILSGISMAVEGVLAGEVARNTAGDERAKAFLILEGIYSVGCGFGPIASAIFTFEANIFGWQINAGNSAMFVMVFVAVVLVILTLFLPRNLSANEDLYDLMDESFITDTDDDTYILETRNDFHNYLSENEYSKISCLFYLIFLTWFFSSLTTFYTPLLAIELFHLDQLQVKLIFASGTVSLLIVYLALYIATGYFQERTLLLFAISLQIIPIILLFIFALFWRSGPVELSYLLLLYICLGILFCAYPITCSLLAKVTNPYQGSFYQSLGITVLHIAIVSGTLVPSFIFTKTSIMLFSIGLGFLWALGLGWFCFVFRGSPNADTRSGIKNSYA